MPKRPKSDPGTSRPERLYNVSTSQFGVARLFGACKINGAEYHYDQASDTLTRMDVWRARCAQSKEAAEQAVAAERKKWTEAAQLLLLENQETHTDA